jgi:hypothetical protein
MHPHSSTRSVRRASGLVQIPIALKIPGTDSDTPVRQTVFVKRVKLRSLRVNCLLRIVTDDSAVDPVVTSLAGFAGGGLPKPLAAARRCRAAFR